MAWMVGRVRRGGIAILGAIRLLTMQHGERNSGKFIKGGKSDSPRTLSEVLTTIKSRHIEAARITTDSISRLSTVRIFQRREVDQITTRITIDNQSHC